MDARLLAVEFCPPPDGCHLLKHSGHAVEIRGQRPAAVRAASRWSWLSLTGTPKRHLPAGGPARPQAGGPRAAGLTGFPFHLNT